MHLDLKKLFLFILIHEKYLQMFSRWHIVQVGLDFFSYLMSARDSFIQTKGYPQKLTILEGSHDDDIIH